MNEATNETPVEPEVETKEKPKGSIWRFLLGLAVFAWVLRSFIVAPFVIPSGSMLPTMLVGDYLFVAKWPYGYSKYSFPFGIPSFDGRVMESLPERGDIVVFRPPGKEDMDYVKRVIGLPGDRIEVRGGQLVLNGKNIERERLADFALPMSPNSVCRVIPPAQQRIETDADGNRLCRYPAYRETLPGGASYVTIDQTFVPPADEFGPVTVPEGFVFVMGDNRDDSLDSRFGPALGGVGFVPVDNLVGKAMFNFWSTDGSANYFLPWTWFTSLRGSRIGVGY
ncbi:signal peptidase I [Sphingomicrobium clamense]|uniref:Signal peptidase I n=1 Tax=Sphingomicrobium clamense TaxID=2851013 RepID=A0ABS6V5B0_9SPHN|nr:signal peptidase I [Sphingomicrobium sp. B8]MBW0144749.1 signal peptidase I [Sphingomicrobium sp. B8]